MRLLHDRELEPEVRDWLDSLRDCDYQRVDELCEMLAEQIDHGPGAEGL